MLGILIGTSIPTTQEIAPTTAQETASTTTVLPNYYNEYQQTLNLYNQALQQNQQLTNRLTTAKEPPYIIMEGRTVTTAFKKTDGTTILWEWPADTYQSWVIQGYLTRKSGMQYVTLAMENGKRPTMVDYTKFVDADTFGKVIPPIYDASLSDEEFIKEAWNLVTQLTTYSADIQETPRYPIETITEGGGDCEDMAILMASLLKAADKNWKVQLVYMDADNPENPTTINHALVYVDTGIYSTFIDTTQNIQMNPYLYDTVSGFYFDA